MNRQDFQRRIREAIPLADSMKLEAAGVSSEKVILKAPFAANRNNHGTVFGGSIATLMLLTGWALLQPRMDEEVPGSLAVIAGGHFTPVSHARRVNELIARFLGAGTSDGDA